MTGHAGNHLCLKCWLLWKHPIASQWQRAFDDNEDLRNAPFAIRGNPQTTLESGCHMHQSLSICTAVKSRKIPSRGRLRGLATCELERLPAPAIKTSISCIRTGAEDPTHWPSSLGGGRHWAGPVEMRTPYARLDRMRTLYDANDSYEGPPQPIGGPGSNNKY